MSQDRQNVSPGSISVRVQTADFDVADEYHGVRERLGGRAGAIASFVGLVRDLQPAGSDGAASGAAPADSLRGLHLEHYPGMTERSIEAIVEAAGSRWPLLDAVVIHRVGDLAPAAQIVFVQVASSHRAAAFAACEFIMDYLKTEAVFWKREDSAAGSRWIEATSGDRSRVNAWRSGET